MTRVGLEKSNAYASGFSHESFAVRFFGLFKVSKKILELFKVSKITTYFLA